MICSRSSCHNPNLVGSRTKLLRVFHRHGGRFQSSSPFSLSRHYFSTFHASFHPCLPTGLPSGLGRIGKRNCFTRPASIPSKCSVIAPYFTVVGFSRSCVSSPKEATKSALPNHRRIVKPFPSPRSNHPCTRNSRS